MAKPFNLVGLTGPAGSGKDTVADLLVTHCGYQKMAFADALYAEVSEAYSIEPIALRWRETKEVPAPYLALERCKSRTFVQAVITHMVKSGQPQETYAQTVSAPRSPREILRWWGTEYRRTLNGPSYWTSIVHNRIGFQIKERLASAFVITDVRFPNEADLVRNDYGGQLWQIRRPETETRAGEHASEVTGEEFGPDAVINNSHTVRHLQQLVLSEIYSHESSLRLRVTIED